MFHFIPVMDGHGLVWSSEIIQFTVCYYLLFELGGCAVDDVDRWAWRSRLHCAGDCRGSESLNFGSGYSAVACGDAPLNFRRQWMLATVLVVGSCRHPLPISLDTLARLIGPFAADATIDHCNSYDL
jgi:hypothetical protein